MREMQTNLLVQGQRFIGIREVAGEEDHPLILAALKLTISGEFTGWPEHDEVPWCSAYLNFVCWLLGAPRSGSLRARSWLRVGRQVPLGDALPGWDVVILERGGGNQPGPEVIKAPGHVGIYAGHDETRVYLLGGNQDDEVGVDAYSVDRILGVRRLRG